MDIDQFQATAPAAAMLLMGVALLGVLAAFRLFRKSRTNSYWRFRRSAGQRGWRIFVFSIFLIFASACLCSSSQAIGLLQRMREPATTVILSPSETPTPSATWTPTITQTPTVFIPTSAPLATDLPTETETVAVTATTTATALPSDTPITATSANTNPPRTLVAPLPTNTARIAPATSASGAALLSSTTITTEASSTPTARPAAPILVATSKLQSSVTPPAGARLAITALDSQISGALGPVRPASRFTAGFPRIYFFVDFDKMQNGMLWRGALLKDGGLIDHFDRLWGTATNGNGYFFFSHENGFPAGDYEIQLYLGASETPITSAQFHVSASP